MEFFDWSLLGSFSGAALAVSILTQITKDVPLVRRLPTQLWSYALALATLLLSRVFGGSFDAGSAVLCVFNAAMVSLAANGGYEALLRMKTALQGEA